MTAYRLRQLRSDGYYRPGEHFSARDDGQAVEIVRLTLRDANCELWQGARKVALFLANVGPLRPN